MLRRGRLAVLLALVMILSVSIPVFAAPQVSISSNQVQPGETITFSISNPPSDSSAWIGLFPNTPSASWWTGNWDDGDLSWRRIQHLENQSGDFLMPDEPGEYLLAIFAEDKDDNDQPILKSGIITVGFDVPVITLSGTQVQPGDAVRFSYDKAQKVPSAWIGLFPYTPSASWWTGNWDDADLTWQRLQHLENQSGEFIMPNEPGQYIVALFGEDSNDRDQPLAKSEIIYVGQSAPDGGTTQPTIEHTDVVEVTTVTGEEEELFNNMNIGGVQSGPTTPTTFTLDTEAIITYLHTYHYFNNNTPPGTIGLQSSTGIVYGPWQATGTPGQGNVPNADWHVYIYERVPAGTYTIIDSNQLTWSQNSTSGYAGMSSVRGIRLGQGINGTLEGYVVDVDEFMPITGVEVNLWYYDTLVTTAYTNVEGVYTMNVVSGYYDLEFVYYGYTTTLYYNVPIDPGEMTYFDHILQYPYEQ